MEDKLYQYRIVFVNKRGEETVRVVLARNEQDAIRMARSGKGKVVLSVINLDTEA